MESEARLDRLQSFTRCNRIWAAVLGCTALLWFLLRVVPKPSRASYPCQRAAFPLASGFVLWLCAIAGGMFSLARLRRFVRLDCARTFDRSRRDRNPLRLRSKDTQLATG